MTHWDVIIVGAGVSGLAVLKYCKEAKMNCALLEATEKIGGLWTFRKSRNYGVMSFTHINVSKYNYCYSDFPYPDGAIDYPSHTQISNYIKDYSTHNDILDCIFFQHTLTKVTDRNTHWELHIETSINGNNKNFTCDKIVLATGHHIKPKLVSFPGIESFPGKVMHSSEYKNAKINELEGKEVLVVGIGNSAVDAAVDLANHQCRVDISTRSGAWVLPNYVMGFPTDLYASRFLLSLPWQWLNFILETIVCLISGNPSKWGLCPKMRALQTQPTSYDAIVMCTGYNVDLDYLGDEVRNKVLTDSDNNELQLYKQVFCPGLGSRIAFVGFIQPSSGGIMMCSEVQAQWLVALWKGWTKLPSASKMSESIEEEKSRLVKRFHKSPRHTFQVDPIVYCDSLSEKFGGKPELCKHPTLIPELLFGTCGPAQYRLQGPFKLTGAERTIKKVPVPPLAKIVAIFLAIFLGLSLLFLSQTMIKIFDD